MGHARQDWRQGEHPPDVQYVCSEWGLAAASYLYSLTWLQQQLGREMVPQQLVKRDGACAEGCIVPPGGGGGADGSAAGGVVGAGGGQWVGCCTQPEVAAAAACKRLGATAANQGRCMHSLMPVRGCSGGVRVVSATACGVWRCHTLHGSLCTGFLCCHRPGWNPTLFLGSHPVNMSVIVAGCGAPHTG